MCRRFAVRCLVSVAWIINRIGIKLTRSWRYPQCDVNLLEIAVPAVVARRGTDFFFLQVGASDGKTNDPLYPLVAQRGLKGLCVEPLPVSFRLLQKTYADRPGVILENAAISDLDGKVELTVADGAESNIELAQKSSLSGSCVKKHLSGGRGVTKVLVPALTVGSLCKKHGIKHVSLLQVDTEGFDYHVIRQALEAGLQPDAIHFESLHLSKEEMGACRRFLRDNGYALVESTVNTLAWQKQTCTPE